MSNIILQNKQLILKCSNGLLDLLYNHLNIIIDDELIHNAVVRDFVHHLDQQTYGLGCIFIDIKDFFKKRHDMILFIHILNEAINSANKEKSIDADNLTRINNFTNNLIIYLNTLDK